jgi:RNA recognition motif-containing protein
VCNVPEAATEDALASVFSLYGQLESVRLLPNRHAVFANFTSIASAILARESLHGRPKPPALLAAALDAAGQSSGATEATPVHERPLHINFTTAQQNCMRARSGRSVWAGDERRVAGYASGAGPTAFGGRGVGLSLGPRPTSRPRGQAAAAAFGSGHGGGGYGVFAGRAAASAGASPPPARSRGLYLGSLPTSADLTELADLFEKYSDVESLRLVRAVAYSLANDGPLN